MFFLWGFLILFSKITFAEFYWVGSVQLGSAFFVVFVWLCVVGCWESWGT